MRYFEFEIVGVALLGRCAEVVSLMGSWGKRVLRHVMFVVG